MANEKRELSDANRARLREHFSVPFDQHVDRWDNLWERGDFLPWDRGLPSPALVDALKDKVDIIGPAVEGSASAPPRKTAFVPGCGKGYDVLLLAAAGYNAIGLEISKNALAACEKFAEENWESYASKSDANGSGTYKFVLGDFFQDDWRDDQAGFDLIYDYTFFCALPPEMRPLWAKRQSQLLKHTGHLICLEFPNTKPPSTGGPPFGVKPEAYIAHLTNPGQTVKYTADGVPEPESYSEETQNKTTNELALKRLAHWQPERTHPVGQGTDFVSIWAHKASLDEQSGPQSMI